MVMMVVFFVFFLNQSSGGLIMVMAVDGCGWVGLVVVMWRLWVCGLVLARSSNLWGLWVVIGLAVASGGYWFAGFVGLFMVVLPSKKERETGKREMEEKRKNKKNNKKIIFK